MNIIAQIICSFLISMSVIFIVVELRAGFERRFLVFGATNLLLCLFCAIDIWFQPDKQLLHWTRAQHVLASFFPAMLSWHCMLIVGKIKLDIVRWLFFTGTLFVVLFCTGIMLKASNLEIISTMVYNVTFAPFMVASIAGCFFFMALNMRKVPKAENKMLLFHLAGGFFLAAGGILDLITVLVGHRLFNPIANYSMPGLLGFILVTTITFSERISCLVREREETFTKLRDAYRELEKVQSLKEIGQSTTIINHEIRNYMMMIRGFAELLVTLNPLSEEKRKQFAGSIIDATIKLTTFSTDILELSKSKIIKEKRPLNISRLIRTCVDNHFKAFADRIVITEIGEKEVFMNGDWARMEHVFVNVFKNAIEAGSKRIFVSLSPITSVLLCSVEDNGTGCNPEHLENLFKSFFTTKKETGGTGLGMCIVRSIVESHGGTISAYSKNAFENGEHGLVLNMCFPLFEDDLKTAAFAKDPVLLIKEGLGDVSPLFRVFKNALVNPYVVQNAGEIDRLCFGAERMSIVAAPHSLNLAKKKFPGGDVGFFALVTGFGKTQFVVAEEKETPAFFSEHYLLTRVLNQA
jgi:signal transduction histidine kinase